MVGPGLVDTLVGVRTEKVALGLGEVGWEALAAVLVKVAERGGEGWACNTSGNAERHHTAPSSLASVHLLGELGVNEQVGECRVAVICALDAVEKLQKKKGG